MSQPTFVPPADALANVPRDLRFHPCGVEHPRVLTADGIATFNREGYLKGIPIFDDAEIAGIRHYFDDLLARTLAEGRDSYSISTAHLRHGRVYDLLTHSRIVDHVSDLLGD